MFKELPEIKESMTFNITFHRLFDYYINAMLVETSWEKISKTSSGI